MLGRQETATYSSPGVGKLENSMDREPGVEVHGATASRTWLNDWVHTHTHTGTRGLCSQRAYHQEIKFGGFPCWSSGWETACQYRRHRFDPCCRKIPHDAGQLSHRASITACHPPGRGAHALQQKKPPQWEAHAPRERLAPAQQRRSHAVKNKWIHVFKKKI